MESLSVRRKREKWAQKRPYKNLMYDFELLEIVADKAHLDDFEKKLLYHYCFDATDVEMGAEFNIHVSYVNDLKNHVLKKIRKIYNQPLTHKKSKTSNYKNLKEWKPYNDFISEGQWEVFYNFSGVIVEKRSDFLKKKKYI